MHKTEGKAHFWRLSSNRVDIDFQQHPGQFVIWSNHCLSAMDSSTAPCCLQCHSRQRVKHNFTAILLLPGSLPSPACIKPCIMDSFTHIDCWLFVHIWHQSNHINSSLFYQLFFLLVICLPQKVADYIRTIRRLNKVILCHDKRRRLTNWPEDKAS